MHNVTVWCIIIMHGNIRTYPSVCMCEMYVWILSKQLAHGVFSCAVQPFCMASHWAGTFILH